MKEITVDAMIENMNTVTAFVDDFSGSNSLPHEVQDTDQYCHR